MNILKIQNTKIPVYACLVTLLLPLQSHALDCPKMPEQVRKDWEIEVKAAVGKIGPATGAELESRTRSATKDLMGKLPQADRVYLEQMMYATYCSALRDDNTLSESEKGGRVRAYNTEVRKTLSSAQGMDGGKQGSQSKDKQEAARSELGRMSLQFIPEDFIKSVIDGDVAAVKLFLTAGMDPNVRDRDSKTALMYAAEKGNISMVEALLKANADVNARRYQATPLVFAVGHEDILRLLLNHGADSDSINSAFIFAAGYGNLKSMRVLLDKGADTNLVGGEALRAAALGYTPRAEDGDLREAMLFLLNLGVDVNSRDKDDGKTAMFEAAYRGDVAMVEMLLAHGAEINAEDKDGRTILMVAAYERRYEVMTLLLQKGADLSRRNKKGETALTFLIRSADTHYKDETNIMAMVRALLEKGADVNERDNDGNTPLIIAANKLVAIVNALLNAGANPNAGNKSNRTALQEASFASQSADSNEIVRTLLKHGADINAKDNFGQTALMRASIIWYDNIELVRSLLDSGADVNAKDIDRCTALMWAAKNGRTNTVRILLKRGALVNEEDEMGKTALDYVQGVPAGANKDDLIHLLKKAGAK